MKLFRSIALPPCLAALFLGVSGCGAPETETTPTEHAFDLTTEQVKVGSGVEKYVCYAQTLDRDLTIDRFTYAHANAVHHLLLAKTTAPEPEGLSDCDVLFRTSWVPLFGAGNGTADLDAPAGNGHVLPKGTQLLIQLHLLNDSAAEVTTSATVKMREASGPDIKPIGLYAFGTNDITLPASTPTSVTNDCTVEKDIDIFAWWPHMHRLGTSLKLEVGPSKDALKEVYRIDPWNFDDQSMTASTVHIAKGSMSRVTCSYDNPSATDVTFGESSTNEMCFLPTFVTDADTDVDGCVYLKPVQGTDVPPDPAAGMCGDQMANSIGIGATCTKGGMECMQGLACSADQSSDPGPGFCLKVGGCKTTPDCGGGWATCCAPKEAGGLLNICIPEACRPADCIPQK